MTTFSPVVTDALSAPWWVALREGRLLVQRNPVSGAWQWYPRDHCLDDLSIKPEWVQVCGHGKVFTYSVIHRGHSRLDAPYVCALVELEEGPLMLSQLHGKAVDEITVGMNVSVAFIETDSATSLPVFRPRSHS
ncbi:Zn-ribbon domain-containing OB-fold protein [Pseudomonas sp. Irchel s3h14]|uniref:Zn-ribbon domain-containing OB-fold protein n=1 Tax=Pseudomonas sp. Irchel s3h14 TaxID=2009179 RepID=UPI000BA3EE9A|nr:OB-fold domain-containing protein [Pseudomonas sp. Irchel s3h14]